MRHQQEAELVAAMEHERAAAEAAAAAARASRLAKEVEEAARVVVAELKALGGGCISSSASADGNGSTDEELKVARDVARGRTK